jgi:hypothetical protein
MPLTGRAAAVFYPFGYPMPHSNEFQGGCPVLSPKQGDMVNFRGRNFSSCCAAIPPNGTLCGSVEIFFQFLLLFR